jgi:hypothetical protein
MDIDRSGYAERIVDQGVMNIEHYKYSLDQEVLDHLSERIGKVRGMSLEAYMFYNDYLAQNEDCKYYHRNAIQYGGEWDGNVGRTNNMLTHITVIAIKSGKIRDDGTLDELQKGRIVAPIPRDKLPAISNGLIFEGSLEIR